MNNTATILRIADRFVSPESISSIEKTGDLKRMILIVSFSYFFALLSLLPIKYQLERNRRTIINNLTIELSIPEPVKVMEVKRIIQPPKVIAPVPSSVGAKAIDRPAANPPAKVVGNRVRVNTNDNKPALPADSQLIRANPQAVIAVKTSPPVNTTQASPMAPSVSNAPARGVSPGAGDTSQTVGAGQAGSSSQAGNGGAAGDGKGANGQQIAMVPPQTANVAVAMGNIAPYRRDMLLRLAANWHPKKHKQGNIVIVITLSKDGRLLNTELITSSGDDKLDEYAIATVGKTDFAPLPDWFRGNQLRLKVELAKVEAVKNDI